MRARALTLVALLLVSACGVPMMDDPSVAAGDEVPYGLLDPTVRPTTTLPELASAAATIWLVVDEGIVPVTREVRSPASVVRAIDALAGGATEAERRLGLRSAVPEDAVNEVEVADGVAAVDLSEDFVRATSREQLLALAQLVYTATGFAGVELVRFLLEGEPVDVPRADGSINAGAVTRADYAPLAA